MAWRRHFARSQAPRRRSARGGARHRSPRRLLERRGVVRAETAALNQLHSLLVAAPAPLRERLAGLRGRRLLAACARLRARADEERVLVGVLRRLSGRARALAAELTALDRELEELVA